MKETIKLGLTLFLFTAIAALILAYSNGVTAPEIAKVEEQIKNEARMEILPSADTFEVVEGIEGAQEVYAGVAGGETVGYTLNMVSSGYGGDLEVAVGISNDGTVSGIKILKHAETPGLGANAKNPSFSDQYKGKSVNTMIEVVKTPPTADEEIQAITGATITSRAVTKAVNEAREIYTSALQ
jgi:electron transport complex protein RnfG